jgi:hypothetical protein
MQFNAERWESKGSASFCRSEKEGPETSDAFDQSPPILRTCPDILAERASAGNTAFARKFLTLRQEEPQFSVSV